MSTEESTSLEVALARIEAKLEVALAQHGARLDRLDALASDHETRLREVEHRPYIAPMTLLAFLVAMVTVMVGASTLLDRLVN